MPTAELTPLQLQALKARLTIMPRKVGDHPGDPPKPIHLFTDEEPGFIGVPRSFFFANKREQHEVELDVVDGRQDLWAGPLVFEGTLREEQSLALDTIVSAFQSGTLGGLLRASPGWGKTVFSTAFIARMQMPTLVVVHKEFLLTQWRDRIQQFLPQARIGLVQQDVCDYRDKHVVIAMVHSLVDRDYGPEFYEWPGIVITDETHRIGASTWSRVPPRFPARVRLGITATPRRKDGADNVFYYHLGEVLFSAKEQRMKPKVFKVYTGWSLIQTPTLNPSLISKNLMLKFMCANKKRNGIIIERLVLALEAGRKVLLLSERLQHLADLEAGLRAAWKKAQVGKAKEEPVPTVGYYVGGMKEEELDEAQKAQVIFATKQFAEEGLDIPALDTLFLTTPLSDIEQAAGRILRPFEGKKDPFIVDFRDDLLIACFKSGESRDRQYRKLGWIS